MDRVKDPDSERKLQQLQSSNRKLEKKVAELERAMRSRSPRGKGDRRGQLALPAPAQLAVPAPPTPKGGKGKGKKGTGRGKTLLARDQQIPSFKALMNIKPADRPELCAQAQNTPGVCFSVPGKTLRRRSMFQSTRMRRLWQCHKLRRQ